MGGGTQDSFGNIQFRTERFAKVALVRGWRVRFDVFERVGRGSKPLAYAEIDVEDLASRPSWRLLLSDPANCEAIYNNQCERVPNSDPLDSTARRPSFLEVRTQLTGHEARPVPSTAPPRGHRRLKDEHRKRVMIITRGTRGDVQPFVALARGLVLPPYNCEVILVTELEWKKFVCDARKDLPEGSLRFRPSGGNTMMKVNSDVSTWAIRAGQHNDSIMALMLARSEVEFFPSEGCFYHWAFEENPDFIVFGFTLVHVAMILSESLRIPIVGFLLQPHRDIEPRANPETVMDELLGPTRQIIDSEAFSAAMMQVMERIPSTDTLNAIRLSRGLAPAPRDISTTHVHYDELVQLQVPMVVPIPPVAMGEQLLSPENGLQLTDFIFLNTNDELSPEILEFINAAKKQKRKVVVIAFSSMPVGRKYILELAVEVCMHCMPPVDNPEEMHKPAVICMIGGQGSELSTHLVEQEATQLQDQGRLLVLTRGVPFGALFPRVDAAVLHGGLGVTSEALRAGIPVVTSGILLMDQRFWARRLSEMGCGSEGVPFRQLLMRRHQGPARIVELMSKALDQRPASGSSGTLSVPSRSSLSSTTPQVSWHCRAKEVQQSLLENEGDGVAINARAVYESGIVRAVVVQDSYAGRRGCVATFRRQTSCMVKLFVCCVWCVVCAQLQNFLRIFFGCFLRILALRPCRKRHTRQPALLSSVSWNASFPNPPQHNNDMRSILMSHQNIE